MSSRVVVTAHSSRCAYFAAIRQRGFALLDTLRHEFQVIRLWEQPTENFFRYPGLLPYAALSQTSDRVAVLQQVAQAIDPIADRRQQSNLIAATGILAGLVLEKGFIQRLMRRELVQESVIDQELREEALLAFFSLSDLETWLVEHPEASGGN